MDDTLTWLHLSDLHCRDRTGWDARTVLAALRKDLEELAEVEELRPDLIFFTGDAAYGGLDDEFDAAARFFEDVREICGVERENVFLVPGNHDVDRTAVDADDTTWLDERRRTHDADAVHEMLRRGTDDERFGRIMNRLDAYRRFLERAGYKHLLADPERLIYVERREVRGVGIAVAGLNSAWSCHGDDRGRLWLGGAWQLAETAEKLDGADVRVGLVHHPLSWLGDAETGLGSRFERLFDFHLHGHEHDDWTTQLTGDGHVRIAGGACYDRSDRDNGYNLVRLDFENEMGEVWLRRFESKSGAWQRREIAGKTDAQGVFHLQAGRWCESRRAKDDVAAVLSGERLVDEVFDALRQDPILMLLAQDGRVEHEIIASLRERAKALCPEGTFHVTPPGSPAATPEQYFARLGRQCGFSEDVRDASAFEDALDERLRGGERLFLLMTGFEKGSEEGRRQLGTALRALGEVHAQAFMVVLVGGERLAALKYENDEHSVLNTARRIDWPEATIDDVLAWQHRDFPDMKLGRRAAEDVRELCGGHPRWVRRCLDLRRRGTANEHEELAGFDELWWLFTVHRKDEEGRRRICRWLTQEDLGPWGPWIDDELLRRFYWKNALRKREDGRLTWRSQVVRQVGRRVLGCE